MLGNEYRMPAHGGLPAVVGNHGRRKAQANKVRRMGAHDFPSFLPDIHTVFLLQVKSRTELRMLKGRQHLLVIRHAFLLPHQPIPVAIRPDNSWRSDCFSGIIHVTLHKYKTRCDGYREDPMNELHGKVALVTAGTRGIGLACVRMLAVHGAVVYIAARNEQAGNDIIAELAGQGRKVRFVHFDADTAEDYASVVDKAARQEGRLDILVNNYGSTDVSQDKDLVEGDSDAFFRIVQANIRSVYLTCKHAIPHMKATGGSIINISSIGSVVPDLSRLAYSVSKSAINALTRNIALQYARYNIRCNAVLPGLIATDAALKNMSDEFREHFLRHVPLGRMGRPEDIAAAVLYYAGDASSYVTGMLHEVAGGYALGTPQYADFAGLAERSR